MARLFLNSGQTYETVGAASPATQVFGTNDAEIVHVAGNGDAIFDPSFARGNDNIFIHGNAGSYTAQVSGADLLLTSAAGASIRIPLGEDGVNVKFDDAPVRLVYVNDEGKICVGEQQIPEAGSVTVTAGTGGGGGGGEEEGEPIMLNTLRQTTVGTSGNDEFWALVQQNEAGTGEQANSLATGDIVNGRGNGNDDDVLYAQAQDASALNAGPAAAMAPIIFDVETVLFEALTVGDGGKEVVEVNAKSIRGHNEIGSAGNPALGNVGSDASLVIYNVTTLTKSADYDDRRNTEEVTIRMDHSDNGDDNQSEASYKKQGKYEDVLTPGVDDESDLTVLFDQDYLLCDAAPASGAYMVIELMDMDAAILLNPSQPLETNPIGEITFTKGTEVLTLGFDAAAANTYVELLAEIQAALDDAKLTDPRFEGLTAELGGEFTATDTDDNPVVNGSATGRQIIVRNSGPEPLDAISMRATGTAPAGRDYHTNFTEELPTVEDCKITSTVVLYKVGRGGSGGDLVIGGMDTNGRNEWGGAQGVEQFNITVEGDDTQDSSLSSLQSTNNWLQCVYVTSAEGSLADLTIGNRQTNTLTDGLPNGCHDNLCDVTDRRNGALKDVLIFNAANFSNDATVYGHFSDESVAKYMDLGDVDPDPQADNRDQPSDAVYTFAGGNDHLNMNLSQTNMAVQGTATREDFSFNALMGHGNDFVEIQIGDGYNFRAEEEDWEETKAAMVGPNIGTKGYQVAENWYYNHVLNNNLFIDTGAGHDTVNTWGATAADINLGSGNDTVYTDNSGVSDNSYNCCRAVWVYNTLVGSNEINDNGGLQSEIVGSVSKVANIGLRVTFQGIESFNAVVGGRDANGVFGGTNGGAASGYTVTDLQINQAIKDAINNDPVLSKLLVAEDGPARTLVVRSLIDGEHVATDLVVNLLDLPSTTLNANQISNGVAELGAAAGLANIGFLNSGAATGNRYNPEFATENGNDLEGFDSLNINNNNVEGDTGNDVIVLSSNGVGDGVGRSSSVEGNSVETIDINGFFGDRDVILNFTAGRVNSDTNEVQVISFTGEVPVSGVEFPSSEEGTVILDLGGGYHFEIPIGGLEPAPNTAAEVAEAVADYINNYFDDMDPTTVPFMSAVAVGGDVTITYNTEGVNYADPGCQIVPENDLGEIQQLDFLAIDQVETGTISVAIDGEVATINVGDTNGDTVNDANEFWTPTEIAGALAARFNTITTGSITASSSGAVLTMFGNTDENLTDAVVTYTAGAGQDQTLDWTYALVQNGRPYGLEIECETLVDGAIPARGWDIFDVETVLGGAVQWLTNDVTNRNVGNDGNEANVIGSIIETWREVAIIDTVENDDFAFSSSTLTEAQRIQEIYRAFDGGAKNSQDSLVITVDEDNVGHFYLVDNGNSAKDAVVTWLGDVELGFYVDSDKEEIGNWAMMTMANFDPLTPSELVQTFDIA